ncbi:DNA helicase [Parasphingorhabdus sp.]|uniref:DNA helicase n=1 Tax=Parasphingorhabdus sp. TaxID=2709688 RepID=UPI003002366D
MRGILLFRTPWFEHTHKVGIANIAPKRRFSMKISTPVFKLKHQAKLLARKSKLPLHKALDIVAQTEGFRAWSHLMAAGSVSPPSSSVFGKLEPGVFVLVAARPGQGKTLLGLGCAVEAVKAGGSAFHFTLEDSENVVHSRLLSVGSDWKEVRERMTVDTSDGICADYIIEQAGGMDFGTVIVIDYLQLLDQRRVHSDLATQLQALRSFALATGSIIVALSQVDRSFPASGRPFPALADVRLPNPVDLTLFTKACFLQNGEAALHSLA